MAIGAAWLTRVFRIARARRITGISRLPVLSLALTRVFRLIRFVFAAPGGMNGAKSARRICYVGSR